MCLCWREDNNIVSFIMLLWLHPPNPFHPPPRSQDQHNQLFTDAGAHLTAAKRPERVEHKGGHRYGGSVATTFQRRLHWVDDGVVQSRRDSALLTGGRGEGGVAAGSMEVILRLTGSSSRRREREKKLPAAYFYQLPKKRGCCCCR